MKLANRIINFILYLGMIPIFGIGLYALGDAFAVSQSASVGDDLAELANHDDDEVFIEIERDSRTSGCMWSPRMKKLTKYTTNWPKMMANWFQDTSIPLMLDGATSPIYIGQIAEARPTPTPPITR